MRDNIDRVFRNHNLIITENNPSYQPPYHEILPAFGGLCSEQVAYEYIHYKVADFYNEDLNVIYDDTYSRAGSILKKYYPSESRNIGLTLRFMRYPTQDLPDEPTHSLHIDPCFITIKVGEATVDDDGIFDIKIPNQDVYNRTFWPGLQAYHREIYLKENGLTHDLRYWIPRAHKAYSPGDRLRMSIHGFITLSSETPMIEKSVHTTAGDYIEKIIKEGRANVETK